MNAYDKAADTSALNTALWVSHPCSGPISPKAFVWIAALQGLPLNVKALWWLLELLALAAHRIGAMERRSRRPETGFDPELRHETSPPRLMYFFSLLCLIRSLAPKSNPAGRQQLDVLVAARGASSQARSINRGQSASCPIYRCCQRIIMEQHIAGPQVSLTTCTS